MLPKLSKEKKKTGTPPSLFIACVPPSHHITMPQKQGMLQVGVHTAVFLILVGFVFSSCLLYLFCDDSVYSREVIVASSRCRLRLCEIWSSVKLFRDPEDGNTCCLLSRMSQDPFSFQLLFGLYLFLYLFSKT